MTVTMMLASAAGVMALIFLLSMVGSCFVVVGGDEIAVLERRYFGKQMEKGRVVAVSGEVGMQAKTLGPGFHLLIPFLYKTAKCPFVKIGENEIGILDSVDGNPVPPGKIFAKVVEGHNSFQDGEAFLRNGGEKGPQVQILPPGSYRVNPYLYRVTLASAIVVNAGKVGMVSSMDGQPIPFGRLLAHHVEGHSNFEDGQSFLDKGGQKGPQIDVLLPGTYRINTALFTVSIADATIIAANKVGLVTALDGTPLQDGEYVAKTVGGHSDFQNASLFLEAGGQRGPQFDVLKPGTYYVNPNMFAVALDDITMVERGEVGVVVSNVGEEPEEITKLNDKALPAAEREARLKDGVERYVVPKGFRGIQRDVAGPGRYYLNKRAYIAYIISTTNVTIDWDNSEDTKFNPLQVISKDGFPIEVSVKVIVRVRPDQAPYMVSKIGSIDNLISHVIHPMIDSSFRNQASSTSAMAFMQDRQEEQAKAETRTRAELEKYHVECVSVLICQINLPQELMNTQTQKIIAQQQMAMYDAEREAQGARIATEKTRAQADQQASLVTAEIAVQIAEQTRLKTIKAAEGEKESIRLKAEGEAEGIKAKGDAEAQKIRAIGKSTAEAYESQNRAIGAAGVTAIEISRQIAAGNVKVTPDFLIQGGGADGNVNSLLAAFLTKHIAGMPTAREAVVAEEPKQSLPVA